MQQTTIIRGGLVVTCEGVLERDILVEAGVISALLEPDMAVEAASFDAHGLTIFPGAIDAHVHLGSGNDISRPRIPADIAQESAGAAAGGVTTVLSYVMSAAPYQSFFNELVEVSEAGSSIDFGFHFVISTPDQLASVPLYVAEMGVPTTKLFMNIRGDEGDRLGLPPIDDGFTFALMEQLAAHGGMLCPHPENIEIAWLLGRRLRDSTDLPALALWNAARPDFIEAEAIRRIGYFSLITGCPVYCVHTSSARALEQAMRARDEGAKLFIETCNHYLTHDVHSEIGVVGKINPPLRERADREALWSALQSGDLDTVATDHIHRGIGSKDGDIWKASPGCPGLETFLPVLISEGHHKRGVTLERIAEITSARPAEVMGLAGKGRIAPGYDADLAFVDLDRVHAVDRTGILSGSGFSIYEGWSLKGMVRHTMVRGRPVFQDGSPVASAAGSGRFQKRSLAATPAKAGGALTAERSL